MFSFLRSRPEFRLGVELGSLNWLGVMLDPQGVPQDRHQHPAPPEGERLGALRSLLQRFPLKQCQVVISLPQEYNMKVCELESPDALNVVYESERWLPYTSAEASYAWHSLGPRKTLISVYPTELLQPMNDVVRSLGARSLAWEIPEMACLRTLTQVGLPLALLDLSPDRLRLVAAAEGEFCSLLHYRTDRKEIDLSAHVSRFVDYLKVKRQTVPCALLTNVEPHQIPGWECRQLPSDYLAIALAQSPPGPHQFCA